MKFIFSIIAIAFIAAIVQNFAPWWSIAIVAFIVSFLMKLKPGIGFLAGFLALFILWAGIAAKIDFANEHILSVKMAQLFPLKGNYIALLILTGVIGGLVAGFAALSGSLLRTKQTKLS